MKKKILTIFTFIFCLAGLASCGPEHQHSFGEWVVDSEPTCTEKGSKHRTCDDCGEVETKDINTTGHNYGVWTVVTPETCTTDGLEKHTCECGAEETRIREATGHNFTDWTVVTPETCTTDGQEKRTCKTCGEVETRTITKLGHDEPEVWEFDVENEVTVEDGEHWQICNRCEEKINVGNHEWKLVEGTQDIEWIIDTPLTCQSQGLRHKTCSICGAKVYENFGEVTGAHSDFVPVEATEPHMEEGQPVKGHVACYACGVCGTLVKDETGTPLEDTDYIPFYEVEIDGVKHYSKTEFTGASGQIITCFDPDCNKSYKFVINENKFDGKALFDLSASYVSKEGTDNGFEYKLFASWNSSGLQMRTKGSSDPSNSFIEIKNPNMTKAEIRIRKGNFDYLLSENGEKVKFLETNLAASTPEADWVTKTINITDGYLKIEGNYAGTIIDINLHYSKWIEWAGNEAEADAAVEELLKPIEDKEYGHNQTVKLPAVSEKGVEFTYELGGTPITSVNLVQGDEENSYTIAYVASIDGVQIKDGVIELVVKPVQEAEIEDVYKLYKDSDDSLTSELVYQVTGVIKNLTTEGASIQDSDGHTLGLPKAAITEQLLKFHVGDTITVQGRIIGDKSGSHTIGASSSYKFIEAIHTHDVTVTLVNDDDKATVTVETLNQNTALCGTELTITIAGKTGFVFDGVTVSSGKLTEVTAGSEYKLVLDDEDCEITVSFIENANYAVTFESTTHGSYVVKNGEDEIESGDEIAVNTTLTIVPTPDQGYEVEYVKVNDGAIEPEEGVYSFEVSKASVISVGFKEKVLSKEFVIDCTTNNGLQTGGGAVADFTAKDIKYTFNDTEYTFGTMFVKYANKNFTFWNNSAVNSGYLFNKTDLGEIDYITIKYNGGTSGTGKIIVTFSDSEVSTKVSTGYSQIKGVGETEIFACASEGCGYFQISCSNKNVQIDTITIKLK